MRRILFQMHLWSGLILCLPLVLIAITGSIIVFHHELMELESPELYRVSMGPARPVGEILAAAERASGDGKVALSVFLPEHEGGPAIVRLGPSGRADGHPSGPPGTVSPSGTPASATPPPTGPFGPGVILMYLDPATLAPLGTRRMSDGWVRKIIQLHANLLLREYRGREIVGWLGVVMLVLGATGLVLWWPRGGHWRQAFTIKKGARGLRLHRDIHGVVGIWGFAVFIVVSFSGVYLAFPQPLGEAIRTVFPGRDLRGTMNAIRVRPVRGVERLDPEGAIALAREAVPDGKPRGVMLPARPDQPYRVNLAPPGHKHGAPMVTTFIDPFEKRVVEIRDPRRYTWGETILAWQHAIHAGEGLGWAWKILVFLSGLMPPLFVVTGIYMWWVKRRAKRAVPRREAVSPVAAPGE